MRKWWKAVALRAGALPATVVILGAVGTPIGARAQSSPMPNDLQVWQFGEPCPVGMDPRCVGAMVANDRFDAMTNELAVAISSFNMQPPETTGFSGFDLAFEYAVVGVNKTAEIPGTSAGTPGTPQFTPNGTSPYIWPLANESPRDNSPLLIPMAHFRKGFPFPPIPGLTDFNVMSFEVGGRAGWITGSSMGFGMLEAKWALNEGFTFVPDLGVRGFVSRLIGPTDFDITAAGFDIGIGKQIAIGGMLTLTPYLGWNLIFAQGDSNVIDFFPDRPRLPNSTGVPDEFTNGTAGTNVFCSANMGQNLNNRFYFGLRMIAYLVEVGVEGSYTQLPAPLSSCDNQTTPATVIINGSTVGTRNIFTLVGKLGLDY
jgi:hypothetical protein